ncbi:MAG TPA: hypothetical protein VGT78_08305 [Rhizomicrobium sp.]|nr:hypothetical protein [Rhizomicrobium sp.]
MRRSYLLAATMLVPVLAYAGGAGPAAVMLNKVPGLPANAQSAYAQWLDDNGNLKPGATYKSQEDAIQNAMMRGAMTNAPSAQQQANAQAIAAQYNTPEGRAKIAAMSPAQMMALGQQMQAQMGYAPPQPTAVSEHDQAIMRQLGAYEKTADVRQKTVSIQMASSKLEDQWEADKNKLGEVETAEHNKLPVCPGEAGEPSSAASREVALKYADKRIALADSYLPKFTSYLQQLKQTVGPEIDYGDNAYSKWTQLQNPSLKSQTKGIVQGAENNAYADAGTVLSYVEGVSKKAAEAVADKHNIERMYANAGGC